MKAKIKIIIAMLTWGSMGVLVRQINLPSGLIAFIRAMIGLVFLITVSVALKKPFPKKELAKNKWRLLASGIVLGANWIFIFEAYKHTTIAIATLVYYIAPILIVLISTVILKEKLTFIKVVLMMASLVGLAYVSGALGSAQIAKGNGLGILFGFAAAIAYASFTIMNKNIKGLSSMDTTMAQFGISSVLLLPYTLLNEKTTGFLSIHWNVVLMLLILGIVHTGIAFWLFFSAIRELKAGTIAGFCYLDPITAVILSALFLHEKLGVSQILGACIVLGSAFLSGYVAETKTLRIQDHLRQLANLMNTNRQYKRS
jgi:drug/metabolite transporter (DMT)-like permease